MERRVWGSRFKLKVVGEPTLRNILIIKLLIRRVGLPTTNKFNINQKYDNLTFF